MLKGRSDSGRVGLELVVAALLLASGALLYLPVLDSNRIYDNEARTVDLLREIAQAQADRHASGRRPGFLAELAGLTGDAPALTLPEDAGAHGLIVMTHGFCFVIYLADEAGEGRLAPEDGHLRPDFWIAYVWPEEYGESGRRLFVVDSSGLVRSWENQRETYSGPGRIPPAHLAPAPKGAAYPLARKRRGWEKSLRWRSE